LPPGGKDFGRQTPGSRYIPHALSFNLKQDQFPLELKPCGEYLSEITNTTGDHEEVDAKHGAWYIDLLNATSRKINL
jgi:hypothetical protein